MRLLFAFLLLTDTCLAGDPLRTSVKALLSYPKMRIYRNNLKNQFEQIPYVDYILIGTKTVMSGRVGSKIYRAEDFYIHVQLQFKNEIKPECRFHYSF